MSVASPSTRIRRWIFAAPLSALLSMHGAMLTTPQDRAVFVVGEPVEFRAQDLPAGPVTWRIEGLEPGLLQSERGSGTITLAPYSLRAGAYTLRLEHDGQALPGGERAFRVVRGLPAEAPRHLVWPDNRLGQIFADPDPARVRTAVEFLAALGFTDIPVFSPSETAGSGAVEAKFRSIGYSNYRTVPPSSPALVRRNLDLVLAQNAASGLRGPAFVVPEDPSRRIELPDGQRDPIHANPWDERNVAEDTRTVAEALRPLQGHPAFQTYFVSSEIEWPLDWSAASRVRLEQELGFLPQPPLAPNWTADGTIAEDDRAVRARRYFFRRGQGDVARNARVAAQVKAAVPGVITWSDPFRHVPVQGAFEGQDMVSTWTYTNPDPKYALAIEHLRAVARPQGQRVMHTVTLLNYPGTLRPGTMSRDTQANYISMSPDRYLECQWINLSRRPDFFCTYFSQSLNPFNDDAATDPFKYCPPVLDAIRRFNRDVLQPAGPLLRRLEVTPRQVALINSVPARVHGKTPRGPGRYEGYEILDLAAVLAMAQVPFDEVFDENLTLAALAGYRVVVLPKADVISAGLLRVLRDFTQRGGTVVVDRFFTAPLAPVVRLDWDLTYRRLVNANNLARGEAAERDDHGQVMSVAEGPGVTADEDDRRMQAYAEDLRAKLNDRFDRELDAGSRHVLLNRLRGDGVDYVVAVNDRRGYDDRVGQWKAILDRGLAERTTFAIKSDLPHPVVCEVLSGRQLAATVEDGWIKFADEIPPAWGAIYAVLPEPVTRVGIHAPAMRRGVPSEVEITLAGASGAARGVHVVRVDVVDAAGRPTDDSGYFSVAGGAAKVRLAPARNDVPGAWRVRARLLGTGLHDEASPHLL